METPHGAATPTQYSHNTDQTTQHERVMRTQESAPTVRTKALAQRAVPSQSLMTPANSIRADAEAEQSKSGAQTNSSKLLDPAQSDVDTPSQTRSARSVHTLEPPELESTPALPTEHAPFGEDGEVSPMTGSIHAHSVNTSGSVHSDVQTQANNESQKFRDGLRARAANDAQILSSIMT